MRDILVTKDPDYTDFLVRLAIDLVSITIFAVFIYLRRHARRDLFMAFTCFNIGLFVVLAIITTQQIPVAVGFGLFAMLSIIRVRSEQFSYLELGYFFCGLVLALVNGLSHSDRGFVLVLNALVLFAVFVVDHPTLRTDVLTRQVTLDSVHTDQAALQEDLERRFDVRIIDLAITEIDYVRDITNVRIRYVAEPSRASGSFLSRLGRPAR